MEYAVTKFLHVTFAIIAVGFNASYGLWLARAAREPAATQLFALRTIKLMDDRVANPLYGLLALSGLVMVFLAGYPLTTFWIAAALVLYVVAIAIAFGVITPNFRDALRALEAEGPESAASKARDGQRTTRGHRDLARGARDRLPHGHETDAVAARATVPRPHRRRRTT